jgi:hypothetical protein
MANRKFGDLDKLVQVWAVGELADEILKECQSLTDLTLLSSSYPIKKYFEDINKSEEKQMKHNTTIQSTANSAPAKDKVVKPEVQATVETQIKKDQPVIKDVKVDPEHPEVVEVVVEEKVTTATKTTTTVVDEEAAALADLEGLFSEVDINLVFSKEDKQLSDIISKEVTTLENRLKEVANFDKTLGGAFATIRTASSLSARVDGLRNLVYLLSTAKNNMELSDAAKHNLTNVINKLNDVITVAHAYIMATNAKDKRSIFRKALDLVIGFFSAIINAFMLVIRKIIDFFFNWNSDDYKKRSPAGKDPVVEPV